MFLQPDAPALIFAPMDGITDAAMRNLQGESGAFSYAVTEFLRVSSSALPRRIIERDVPELAFGSKTESGLPVQVQLLGGDAELMATTARNAVAAGAKAIDINFGCPAPTVNRHDGGASLLRTPCRIRDVVRSVRLATPESVPVSAKVRLGWDSIDTIDEIAGMAGEGGASWLTIHARTRVQGYAPPVDWPAIARVRRSLEIPVVANGDIWTFDDFLRCREATGCSHFMIGRGALANPRLPLQIASEFGTKLDREWNTDWKVLFRKLCALMQESDHAVHRLKQWMKLAHLHGEFEHFHELKTAKTHDELLHRLNELSSIRKLVA